MATTQEFLDLEEIREGTVVMKDRAIRGIMLVSSMNFALKAEDDPIVKFIKRTADYLLNLISRK